MLQIYNISLNSFRVPDFVKNGLKKITPNVDFNYYLKPLIDLIKKIGSILSGYTIVIINYSCRILSATQVVFSQLFFSPLFDPSSPSFQKQTDLLENKLSNIEKRFDLLQNMFKNSKDLTQDLNEVRSLKEDIAKGYNRMIECFYFIDRYHYENLDLIRLMKLRTSYKNYVDKFCHYYCDHAQDMVNLFRKWTIALPNTKKEASDGRNDILKKAWSDLKDIHAFFSHQSSKVSQKDFKNKYEVDILKNLQDIKINIEENVSSKSIDLPINLLNFENSCYLDSVMVSMLSIDTIRNQLIKPIPNPTKPSEEHTKRISIQIEIIKLLETPSLIQVEVSQKSPIDLILNLEWGEKVESYSNELRKAIFESALHDELTGDDLIYSQNDAINVISLMLEHFLSDCSIELQRHITISDFQGIEFKNNKTSKIEMLLLGMEEDEENEKEKEEKKELELKDYINEYFKKVDFNQKLKIVPTDWTQVNSSNFEEQKSDIEVKKFTQWFQITELPSILFIQIKKFSYDKEGNKFKKDNPVVLPKNGILDLSDYYKDTKNEKGEKRARYKIKSLIRHIGTLENGHFVAAVEYKGEYYHCDDFEKQPIRISSEQFFDYPDAYLLILEKETIK